MGSAGSALGVARPGGRHTTIAIRLACVRGRRWLSLRLRGTRQLGRPARLGPVLRNELVVLGPQEVVQRI
jgi:hypothetical protein